VVQALAYGVTAVLTWWFARRFLSRAGVPSRQIWWWAGSSTPSTNSETAITRFAKALAVGVGGGLLLGICALGYLLIAGEIPLLKNEILIDSSFMLGEPLIRYAYAVMAIGMAPFAEEYLFRGLLFRALDREWGGWRAIIGSALLFGVYHPPLSWLPVTALGVLNAWLFKRTGSLWPCVLAHMAYNTVMVLAA
jgi:membrane protease YdiL (CAAX protease family)